MIDRLVQHLSQSSLPCGGVFEMFQTDLLNNFSFHQLLVIVLAGLRHLFIK